LADDEYLPEYGTLVIRDRRRADALPPLENELLGELATSALAGTVATAGDAWLHGHAGDHYQAVRLEAHDTEPPVPPGDWEEVFETPFHTRTGFVGLGSLTGGDSGSELALGDRGFFRARVVRKAAEEGEQGDVWLTQFWPVQGIPEPPRWVKRTRAAVSPADPGWREVLGYQVIEVSWFLGGMGMPRPDGWLDELLPGNDKPTASVCEQLGVPVPMTRRDTIPLLVAAGLIEEADGGYRGVGNPALATEKVRLPVDLAARIEAGAVRARYVWLAADLTSVAAWRNPASTEGLVERLLIGDEHLNPLIAHAVADKYLHHDSTGITALARPAPTHVRMPVPMVASRRREEPETVPGGPPRAGFVTGDGEVVVWRDGEPVVLGRATDEYLYRAFETTAGVFVSTSRGPGTLVRWNGTTERLAADTGSRPVRSADGRYLAGVETHTGRHTWDQVHLVDVVEGTVASLPKTEELTRQAHGIHGGAVYFSVNGRGMGPLKSYRWSPGREPEPLGLTLSGLDPLSGTMLGEDAEGLCVLAPDGSRFPVTAERPCTLMPGGARLYNLRYSPPMAEVLNVGSAEPVEHSLPDRCETSAAIPAAPVWEDAGTLVFSQRLGGPKPRIVRWHLPSGTFEQFALPANAGYRPFLVQPRLGAG
jgi:hypothetical protein